MMHHLKTSGQETALLLYMAQVVNGFAPTILNKVLDDICLVYLQNAKCMNSHLWDRNTRNDKDEDFDN